MTARRHSVVLRLLRAFVVLAAAGMGGEPVFAQAIAKKPAHRSQMAHPGSTAVDRTGSTAKTPDPSSPLAGQVTSPAARSDLAAKAEQADAALTPFYLPDAPRARMRACGETWRARKLAGAIGDDYWRDFAAKCLVATDNPTSP